MMGDLPCDTEGICMVCRDVPHDERVVLCSSCGTPWHMDCLKVPLDSLPIEEDWSCPDCNLPLSSAPSVAEANSKPVRDDLVGKVKAVEADSSLSEQEKCRRRQDLLLASQGNRLQADGHENTRNETLELVDQRLNCIFCLELADRPVSTPCGHNFCLKCFQRWVGQGKKNCVKCRAPIPAQMAGNPRINSKLVIVIRLAKTASAWTASDANTSKAYHPINNENRPDKCFVSERAVMAGRANASSGRIMVTVPPDHFGPISAENDPHRGQGVLVGEIWEDRMECRQWGVHRPHVAGIAGQSDYGAQSVALSGGYEDDEDHGDWFLYTGSGGRDLSGNRRTSKAQSFDQTFDKLNAALRVSCDLGYPVRVIRSHKEKRSAYAPEKGVRYDGVYRIEKCWSKAGIQGHKVCRYLFVRCDNEPAPWTSDEHGDKPRPLPKIPELLEATDVFERESQPSWDWNDGTWGWIKDPPSSRKTGSGQRVKTEKRKHHSLQQKLLKEFGCSLCQKVMKLPLTTPCGHNFCKSCLEAVFSGQQETRERIRVGGQPLRVQKVTKLCPLQHCKFDITAFLDCTQVNREMEELILSLQRKFSEDGSEECDGRSVEIVSCALQSHLEPLQRKKDRKIDNLYLSLPIDNPVSHVSAATHCNDIPVKSSTELGSDFIGFQNLLQQVMGVK